VQWALNLAVIVVGILTIRPMGFSGRGLAVAVLLVINSAALLARRLPESKVPKHLALIWLTLGIVAAAALIGVSRSGTSYLFAFFLAGHIGYRLDTKPALVLAGICSLLCGGVLYFHLGPGHHLLPWALGFATGTPVLVGIANRCVRGGRVGRTRRPGRGPNRSPDRAQPHRPGRARRSGALAGRDQHAVGTGRRTDRHR
jgi:hypothetical protein